MDIAAMSIAKANLEVRAQAKLAIMDKAKNMMEQQGQQIVKMLKLSQVNAPHPTLGSMVDTKA